jgi:hypothetical protein
LFGKPTALEDHRPIGLPQTLCHQLLVADQNGSIRPGSLPQKLLPRADRRQIRPAL